MQHQQALKALLHRQTLTWHFRKFQNIHRFHHPCLDHPRLQSLEFADEQYGRFLEKSRRELPSVNACSECKGLTANNNQTHFRPYLGERDAWVEGAHATAAQVDMNK